MNQDQSTGPGPNARFLAGDVSSHGIEVTRAGSATLVSLLVHGGLLGLLLLAIVNPASVISPETPARTPHEIVWLQTQGPGGGGGGGGNRSTDPPRRIESKGAEKVTVPIEKPKTSVVEPESVPTPPRIQIPAQPTAVGLVELPGTISTLPIATASLGTGSDGGVGSGKRGGLGGGAGSGLEDGSDGGTGGERFRPGNGVEWPVILHEERPIYTAGAMGARLQGVVEVEATVLPDGSVGQVQIVRSLDDRFGLDDKAVEAVRRWRFRPGTRQGKPVAVLVNIELTFTLR